MMIKRILPVCCSAALLMSSSVFADAAWPTKGNDQALVGVQLGVGGMQTAQDENAASYSTGGLTYRLYGAYLFAFGSNWLVGPEVGYLGYPKNTYDFGWYKANYQGYTIDALLNATYQTMVNWYFTGKLGIGMVNQTLNVDGGDSTNKSKILPELGVGLGYQFTPQLALDFSFSELFGGKADPVATNADDRTEVSSVGNLALGLSYWF